MTHEYVDASFPKRRYVANCSMLFTERPLLERPAAAKAAGFDGIEFWWPFSEAVPNASQVEAFVSAILDAGVQLVALNFAAGDMAAGDRGLFSWPGRQSELQESVAVAKGIGQILGTRLFNALYGNRLDGVNQYEQDALATANLAWAAQAIDGVILLEPLSGAPKYPLRTAADVVAVINRVDQPNLRLLADLYHLAANGDDLLSVVGEHAGRIGHVQIADFPGRHEPGTGELDLEGPIKRLLSVGYEGWIALEYLPKQTTEKSFSWLGKYEHFSSRRDS